MHRVFRPDYLSTEGTSLLHDLVIHFAQDCHGLQDLNAEDAATGLRGVAIGSPPFRLRLISLIINLINFCSICVASKLVAAAADAIKQTVHGRRLNAKARRQVCPYPLKIVSQTAKEMTIQCLSGVNGIKQDLQLKDRGLPEAL
jgi:hypothetical protein